MIAIAINVLAPVFALIAAGYFLGPRLQLEGRTLSRVTYFLLTPAFVFNVLSRMRLEVASAGRMIAFVTVAYLGTILVAFVTTRLLRRTAGMTAAYVMIASFGNTGALGLPIIQFAEDAEALGAATVCFLANLVLGFIVCEAAANFSKGINLTMVGRVFRTPALVAMAPALLMNWAGLTPPVVVGRVLDLLSGAMIPVALLVIGVQIASVEVPKLGGDMLLSTAIRLVGGATMAFAMVDWFGLPKLEHDVAILQVSMPSAVLVSIIAVENRLLPEFVTMTVLFSNLVSMVPLSVVLSLLK